MTLTKWPRNFLFRHHNWQLSTVTKLTICCTVAVLQFSRGIPHPIKILLYLYINIEFNFDYCRINFGTATLQHCNTRVVFSRISWPPNCGQECHDQMTLMTHHDRSHFLKSIYSVFIFRESHYTGSCHTLSFLMYAQGVLSVKNSVICMNFSTLAKEAGKHIRPFLVHIRSSFSKM